MSGWITSETEEDGDENQSDISYEIDSGWTCCRCHRTVDPVALGRSGISDVSSWAGAVYRRCGDCVLRGALVVDTADWCADFAPGYIRLVCAAPGGDAAPGASRTGWQVRSRHLHRDAIADQLTPADGYCRAGCDGAELPACRERQRHREDGVPTLWRPLCGHGCPGNRGPYARGQESQPDAPAVGCTGIRLQ